MEGKGSGAYRGSPRGERADVKVAETPPAAASVYGAYFPYGSRGLSQGQVLSSVEEHDRATALGKGGVDLAMEVDGQFTIVERLDFDIGI